MQVLNTLFPVFSIILAGWLLRRLRFADRELFQQLNRLVYWIALPCLLFLKTAQSAIKFQEAGRIFLVLLTSMAGCLVIAYVISRIISLPKCNRGVLLQGASRGNLAYVGLPLILFAVSDGTAASASSTEALAVVAIAPLVPIYNVVAVLCLLHDRHCMSSDRTQVSWSHIAWGILTNPLILSCIMGIGWSLLGYPLPLPLARTLGTIAGMALPLALMGLGAALSFQGMRSRVAPAVAASLIKVIVAPAIGLAAGIFLNLTTNELKIAILYSICPAAVASYVMAQQMRADYQLAADIVVVSTLLAFPVVAVVLFFF